MNTLPRDLPGHAEEALTNAGPARRGWLFALVVALVLVIVALSAALVTQSASEESTTPAAAPTQPIAPDAYQLAGQTFLVTVMDEAVAADAEMVALVDEFIIDYNATRPRTVTSSHWGPDSVLWADNPWASPEGIGPPPNKAVRISDVVQLGPGPFRGRDMVASRAPIWVAFDVRQGGWRQSWIQEWTPDGDVILAMWVIASARIGGA